MAQDRAIFEFILREEVAGAPGAAAGQRPPPGERPAVVRGGGEGGLVVADVLRRGQEQAAVRGTRPGVGAAVGPSPLPRRKRRGFVGALAGRGGAAVGAAIGARVGGPVGAAVGSAIPSVLAGLGGFGIALGVAGAAIFTFAEAAKAVGALIQGTIARVREFSPELQVAQARQEALELVQNIQTARQQGQQLAEFAEERGALKREFTAFKDKFVEIVTPAATGLLRQVNEILGANERTNELLAFDPTEWFLNQPWLSQEVLTQTQREAFSASNLQTLNFDQGRPQVTLQ